MTFTETKCLKVDPGEFGEHIFNLYTKNLRQSIACKRGFHKMKKTYKPFGRSTSTSLYVRTAMFQDTFKDRP